MRGLVLDGKYRTYQEKTALPQGRTRIGTKVGLVPGELSGLAEIFDVFI
jgi:hypothetical protein